MFNHTTSQRDDMLRLTKAINDALETRRARAEIVTSRFEKFWPDLEAALSRIAVVPDVEAPAVRDPASVTEEVVTLVRDMSRSLGELMARRPPQEEENRPVRAIIMSRFSERLRELGIRYKQMQMCMDTRGGISVTSDKGSIEVAMADALDFVDGLIRPVDFISTLQGL